MIDNLSILLSHALLGLALWILMNRSDLDNEEPPAPDTEPCGFKFKRPVAIRKPPATPDA